MLNTECGHPRIECTTFLSIFFSRNSKSKMRQESKSPVILALRSVLYKELDLKSIMSYI